MAPRIVIGSLRPGWSRPGRSFGLFAVVARVAVLAFVFHLSSAAHLLADVLLDDDLTCVDDLAHKPHQDSTAPRCPVSQGVGQGQGVAPPETDPIRIAPPTAGEVACAPRSDAAPPSVPPRSIERPPRV